MPLFLWTMKCTCLYCSFCGLWYTYVCNTLSVDHIHVYTALSVDYDMHMSILLLFVDYGIHMSAILWTTDTRLDCSFCGLWYAYVYTALFFIDYDIHMSAILWSTYTCLYYSCCGLHIHVYNAFSVDHPAAATPCGWHDVQIPRTNLLSVIYAHLYTATDTA